ncbi:MAG: nitroreductase family protein [Bacteroidales bacterium]|nr:nitroreductase family protein [Bacteroidales bacterium]
MNTIELLKNHRSIRKYQDRPIPQEVMDRIIECGGRASNTGNMQLYSVVVTQEAEKKAELAKLHYGQGATCAAYLTICVDVNRYHHWTRQRGCDEPYDNFLWLMSGTIDASLFAQNLCVAAEAEGLGFCFLGTVLYNAKPIAELLNMPKGVVPVITLSLGYPDQEGSLSERLPIEGIVHQDVYHDYNDQDIDRIHELRETFPFNQEMVKVNGTKNLAEIFTKIRYPKKDNIAISQSLLNFVEQAGMMNQ